MKLLVATRSAHKMAEIREILAGVPGLELLALGELELPPDPPEDDLEPHNSFEANACSKAQHFFALTGIPTVADDSGIEVDALGGAPGVRSKRFAPNDGLDGLARDLANNRYLLASLRHVPPWKRTARYVCVAALVTRSGECVTFRGEAPGLVIDEPRGSGGFGYDPHMLDVELGLTYAEMTAAEKNARSHRGKAFRALRDVLVRSATVGGSGKPVAP
jgi:XTP/dITP diphosphohydrolase